MSLAGGAVATLLDGGVVSLGSIAGFLALLGIAARQSVTQIRHWRELERRDDEPFESRCWSSAGRGSGSRRS